jgi:hypothetical protein
MENFVRVVMEKQEGAAKLDESIFAESQTFVTEQDCTVFQIPLSRELNEHESNAYAEKLANYMFEQGYEDFDIEISSNDLDETDEITYEDDDEFFEDYGVMWYNDDDDPIDEAEYQGRKVKLGKPMAGDVKKFKVYVKNPKGNVVKVNFGHGGSSVKGKSMRIRKNNPAARRSFRARHNCDNPGPRHKARYWSCRKW